MYITYGDTSSGDNIPTVLWLFKPTNEEVDAYYKELLPIEYGEDVGGVNWYLEKARYIVEKEE